MRCATWNQFSCEYISSVVSSKVFSEWIKFLEYFFNPLNLEGLICLVVFSFYFQAIDSNFSTSIFVNRGQRDQLIVSVSHDNSINRDNRIFIILWDFILIFSGSLCCRLLRPRATMRFSNRKLNVEEYTLKFVARYRGGLKYWPVPGNTFPWNFSFSFP